MRIGIVNDLRLAVESLKRAVATLPAPGATIAWVAENGVEAVAKCAKDLPDVVLMDMIMPVMDGVEATRRIMKATPCPILVVTATVEGNAGRVFEALGAGALDAVATPGLAADGSAVNAQPLVRKLQAIGVIAGIGRGVSPHTSATAATAPGAAIAPFVAIGVSTGGPQALAVVLKSFPTPAPWPVVIVQHIDPSFAPGLADWLFHESRQNVGVAKPGEELVPGRIVIAGTSDHVVIDLSGRLAYTEDPRDQPYRPSADVFFGSILKARARPGVAALLTGMGRDGAVGLGRLKSAGWHTIAQDKATSVVWGMPGAAVEIGASTETLAIESVGPAIAAAMSRQAERARRPA